MPRIPVDALIDFGVRLYERLGAPPDIARRVSSSLVQADVYGVTSHGFGLTTGYIHAIKERRLIPAARPTVVRDNKVTALVDGHRGFGQVAGEFAMQTSIQKARQDGVGVVCGVHCGHIGRIGEYSEMAADEGLIGVTLVNANPIVTPYGGLSRTLGTNPIAFAAPVPGSNPIIVDFATSVVAANKLRVARAKGAKIPKGWIVDREGADSDDPNDFYAGGYLLTVGAHKGYGLTIMVEMLAGLLSGTGAAPFDYPGGNGIFMFALSPEFFRPPQEFLADVRHLVSALHGTPPRDGFERVLVPGDPEVIAEAKNLHEGVELDAATWQSLLSAAREVGIEFA